MAWGSRMDDHRPRAAEPERARGLKLALLDGAQSAANILRVVGAAAKREADHRRGVGTEVDPELGQAEIPQVKLHQQREPTEQESICLGHAFPEGAAVDPQGSRKDPDGQAEDRRGQDQAEADPQAAD